MAKQPKNEAPKADVATDVELAYEGAGGKWTVRASELGWPQGVPVDPRIAYLLTNGYRQSMTDAAAFSKKDKDGKSDAELEAMAKEARDKRHAAILSGDVGVRVGGPRLRGIDAIRYDVAEEMLRAAVAKAAKASGKTVSLPTKAAELRPIVERYITANRDAVEAEAQRRFEFQSAEPQGDILADLGL